MSSNQGQSGGAEQRRYARVPIKLDGLIVIDGGQPAECTVRDFCIGGMFISADPALYANVPPQTPATLYFALIVGGEKKDYQVELIIARAVAKGMGVSFVDPKPETLDLLSQLAAPEGMPTLPETPDELGESQSGFAAEFATVAGPLKALAREQVGRIVETYLEQIDEVLFIAARDAGNNVDETRYLDGQRELRDRRERVGKMVPEKVEFGVSIIGNPLSDAEKDSGSLGLSDLSLIEKDEFEEFLAVSEMVSELEPQFSEPLFELGRRLSYLANREVDDSNNPLGPNVLCGAVADGLKGLQSERQVVTRVYRVLHETMARELEGLYQAANALLVEHGILPVVDRNAPAVPRRADDGAGFDAPAGPR